MTKLAVLRVDITVEIPDEAAADDAIEIDGNSIRVGVASDAGKGRCEVVELNILHEKRETNSDRTHGERNVPERTEVLSKMCLKRIEDRVAFLMNEVGDAGIERNLEHLRKADAAMKAVIDDLGEGGSTTHTLVVFQSGGGIDVWDYESLDVSRSILFRCKHNPNDLYECGYIFDGNGQMVEKFVR